MNGNDVELIARFCRDVQLYTLTWMRNFYLEESMAKLSIFLIPSYNQKSTQYTWALFTYLNGN